MVRCSQFCQSRLPSLEKGGGEGGERQETRAERREMRKRDGGEKSGKERFSCAVTRLDSWSVFLHAFDEFSRPPEEKRAGNTDTRRKSRGETFAVHLSMM